METQQQNETDEHRGDGSDSSAFVRRFWDHNALNGFLSNFYDAPIIIDGLKWRTSEHYYQAMKHENTMLFGAIRNQPSARQAKDLARSAKPYRAWGLPQKIPVMRKAVLAKFTQHPELKVMLLDTGNDLIIEASPVDSFWVEGADGNGVNMMGLLLMEARSRLSA